MDQLKKDLKGSPSRDEFKHWHKTLNKRFYAADIDFCLVEKEPPGIVAFFDYKKDNDNKKRKDFVTFAEAIQYNELVRAGFLLFIVFGNEETGLFTVERYIWGDPRPEPPKIKFKRIKERITKPEFELWEGELRRWYRERRSAI